jgi:hypothetical protein
MGVWKGTFAFRFGGNESQQIRLTVDASGEGHLVFGAGVPPPPPQSADEFFPSGHYDYPHSDLFRRPSFPEGAFIHGVYQGFQYPIRLAQVASELEALGLKAAVTLRARTSDLFSQWCGLQQPTPGQPICGAPGFAVPIGNGDQCDYYESDPQLPESGDQTIGRESCWKREMCGIHCWCDGSGCGVQDEEDIQLDGQLDDDNITAWVRFPAPPLGDAAVTHTVLHKEPNGPR